MMAEANSDRELIQEVEFLRRQVAGLEKSTVQISENTKTIIDSLCHPFYIINAADYTINMANSAARMTDSTETSTCYSLTHGRDKPCEGKHVCPVEEVKKTKKPVVVEHIHYDNNGNPRNVEVHSCPIFDENGDVAQIIEYVLDVTEYALDKEKLAKSRDQLRKLSSRLQEVREDERTEIAREIHDEFGQAMTALKIGLSWIRNHLTAEQKDIRENVISMVRTVDNTLQSVKRISTQLRPGILDDLGLLAAIEWQTAQFEKQTEIICDIVSSSGEIVLDRNRSTAVFRIFQEALTNIARHANATAVTVSLASGKSRLAMKVTDNGKGITREQISSNKSLGLLGMRERIFQWDGKLTITGEKGKGTTLEVSIPTDGRGKK